MAGKNPPDGYKDTSNDASLPKSTAKNQQASTIITQNQIISGAIKPRHLVPGMTTDGDMYRSAGTDFARIPVGQEGDLFSVINGIPAWSHLTNHTVDELNLIFSDNTIANVTIAMHGLAPKLPNDDTKYFNGIGTYTVPTVVESQFNFTDITTANVSTTKHGLTPKLPNDATKFLNGSGTYTVPTGSGGFSERVRVNNSTTQSIAATTTISVSFDTVEFDTNSMYSGGNPTRITFTTAGVYMLGATFSMDGMNTINPGQIATSLQLNGASQIDYALYEINTTQQIALTRLSTIYSFSAADYVELSFFQSTGGTRNIQDNASYPCVFWAFRIG